MIPLSNATKELKNSLFDSGAWLYFVTLKNRDESITIRIVNNNEDVTFQGETFNRFPFSIDSIPENNKGDLPSINLVMSNVDRIVQAYVEQDEDYGSGWSVKIDIVHNTALASGISELQFNFKTINATATEQYVTFVCAVPNPIRQQFPRIKMLPNSCQNIFKRGGCIYAGNDESCLRTIQDCRQKFPNATKIPFLGFPAIPTSNLYV